MADTELGVLRRPPRPLTHRLERLARGRAEGLANGSNDALFPSGVSDAVVFAASGGSSGGDATGSSAATAKWEYDTFSLTSTTPNTFDLTAVPVEKSEVVRVNGLVLTRAEYSITGSTLTFTDLAAVRLGIGADTWTIALNYAYTDLADSPHYVPPALTDPDWVLNGDAVLVGSDVSMTDVSTGDMASTMVATTTIPDGWSYLSMTIELDYLEAGFAGDGFVFGLLDSSLPTSFLGGTGSDLAFATPADDQPYCVAKIITYSALVEASIRGQVDNATVEGDSISGPYFANGANTYELALTRTTTGRASAVLSWNGTPILSSTSDLYIPATSRLVVTAANGGFTETVTITGVTVSTDAGGDPVIAVPGGTYTPPTPPATPGTHVLRYQRPDTTGYTPLDVAAGGTFNLDQDTDYAITASTPITNGYVRLVGGRNLDVYGLIFDFDPTIPTGSYDAERRGLHYKDGPNPDLKRVIYEEGTYYRSGYYSDGTQMAFRHENAVTYILQALRSDAYGWGQRSGVHSDLVQFYGGPLNFFGDCITGKHQTYQGIFMRPADGRSLPSGADKTDWQLSRTNLESSDGPSGGAHYLLWDDQPAWTNLTLDEVYITGAPGYDVTDGNANMPATGLFQNATPSGGDWAPSSWWVGDTYVSPGYV